MWICYEYWITTKIQNYIRGKENDIKEQYKKQILNINDKMKSIPLDILFY